MRHVAVGRRSPSVISRVSAARGAGLNIARLRLTVVMQATIRQPRRRLSTADIASGYRALARSCWRRRKGGYSRRLLRRALVLTYVLPGSPVLANTCCTSLMSAAAISTSSVALPT